MNVRMALKSKKVTSEGCSVLPSPHSEDHLLPSETHSNNGMDTIESNWQRVIRMVGHWALCAIENVRQGRRVGEHWFGALEHCSSHRLTIRNDLGVQTREWITHLLLRDHQS